MAWIIRILGIICVLGGIVILNLDLINDGRFFLNYALMMAEVGGYSRWFGLFLWIMPIYVGIILLITASMEPPKNRRM